MGRRGKVVLAKIEDDYKRKASLKKRKDGLVNKVSELTKLCDAKAAIIIYTPGDNQPTVWPSSSEARETISKFLDKPERMANSVTAKSFLEEKLKKKKNKAEMLKRKNDEREIQLLLSSIHDGKTKIEELDAEQKEKLITYADKKKAELLKYIQNLKENEQQAAAPRPPVSQATSGLNMNGLGRGRNFPAPDVQRMNLLCLTPNPFVMFPNNTAPNRFNFYGQTNLTCPVLMPAPVAMPTVHSSSNFGAMMQHSIPWPLSQLAMPHVPSTASARAYTGDDQGDFGGMIQQTPPFLPVEWPRRLGLPPMPDETNFGGGTSNGGFLDIDTEFELSNPNVPSPFYFK